VKFTRGLGTEHKVDPTSLLHTEFAGNRFCTRCAGPGELFCFRGGHIGICSGCTADALASHADRLPFDLLVLESEAVRAAAARRAKERQPETVKLDTFYRCHDCGRVIETRNARYPRGRFRRGTPPHCTSCYGKIKAGGPIREEDTSLFADMVDPGRGAAALTEALAVEPMGPPLEGGCCPDCGEVGSVFAFGYQVLICCPACVVRMLDKGPAANQKLGFPLWLLLREARKEIRDRERAGPADVALTPLTCGCGRSTVGADSHAGHHVLGRRRAPACPACSPRLL
jgi:hypothetical protein